MKKQITFTIAAPETFDTLTNKYFTGFGFKKVSQTNDSITYRKGSMLSNLTTFNPLNWKSTVTIAIKNVTVEALFDISTTGQLVTPKEEALWNTFVENYKMSLIEKVDMTEANVKHLKETRRNSWSYIKWALLGAIIVGVPAGFLANFSGVNILAPMGAAMGAVVFMTMKKNREADKNI